VLPGVSAQPAAEILHPALAPRDAGDVSGAPPMLEAGGAKRRACARDEQIADARNLLTGAPLRLGDTANDPRTRG
jgi:hypothetical protein